MTAELIVGNNKPIMLDNLLDSRNVGIFSGMTLEGIEEQYPKMYEQWISGDPSFCPPGGESTYSLTKRCKNFIEFLKNSFSKDAKILIITHRENLAILAYLITGKRIEDALRRVENCKLYNFELDK
jgi:broad specificity phosphatase PhoE